MLLVLSITFKFHYNIWVVCAQLPHFSICDWKGISIAHVIIIIKSEVSTFPIVIIFFRGYVPKMFVASYSVTYCIYVPGKSGICFHYYCKVYGECKYSDTFWPADRTRLFVQYTISLPSLYKLISRHWTYKMPVRHTLSNVWVRLSIFSPLSILQYVGLFVFSLPISLVMIEIIYILCLIIIIKSEVWTVTHCLGLGHETMVSAVCLSIFLFFWHKLVWHWSCEIDFFLLVRSGGEIDWDIIIGQSIILETNLKIKHSPLTVQIRASHLPVSPRTMHVTQNSYHYTVFLPRPNWRAPLLHHCFWFMRHEQRVSENLKNYSRDWNIYTLGSSAFVATLKLVMK